MNWKEQLKKLDSEKKWDIAIEFMQYILENNPDDMDAYLSINYLLMNLLVEEDHDESKHDYYENLLKQYFNQSYIKFSNNVDYLYYTGKTALMSEWYMGLSTEDAETMILKAQQLEPNNLIYKWDYYFNSLDFNDIRQQKEAIKNAQLILEDDSPIKKELEKYGSLGEYVFDIMSNCAQQIIDWNTWKEQLKELEHNEEWNKAIQFMQHIIIINPNNIDVYLSIDYLLMNLLVEEQHDESKHDYYENLLKQYFNQSYTKFSNSAEYLYYTGRTALISEWYMGLDTEGAEAMIEKARLLEPNNLIYNMDYYRSLDLKDPKQLNEAYNYAKMVLEENSPVKAELMKKGSLGEYIYSMMLHWNQDVINLVHQNEKQIK